MIMLRPSFANDAIFVDEVGIEIGVYGDFRLKTAYQPIFRREPAALRPVAVEGFVATFREGQPVPASTFFGEVLPRDILSVESLCRALHLRNHRNIGVPSLDLLFGWDPRAKGDLSESLAEIMLTARLLHEIEFEPRQLVCEIAEATTLHPDTLLAVAGEMRGHGMRVAVGDFGHAAAGRVGSFKPDIVRIDGAWFRRLCEDGGTARLFGPIAATLRQLGSQVLVEGIETSAQLRVAIDSGADLLQGSLLARPALAGTIFDEAPVPLEKLLDTRDNVVSLLRARRD